MVPVELQSPGQRAGWTAYRVGCWALFAFLLIPLLVIIPLSFNALPYFSFTEGMLKLQPSAYSTQWYQQVLTSSDWRAAFVTSAKIAVWATILATVLGTLAAVGLWQATFRGKQMLLASMLLPLFTPHIVLATGLYFLYAKLGMLQTTIGVVCAHAAIASPLVVLSVGAALAQVDPNLLRASFSLGANPFQAFRTVIFPLTSSGVVAGAILAFLSSFDELVIVLFIGGVDINTVPRQMWAGVREDLSPRVLAVSTLMTVFAVVLLIGVRMLQGRRERLGRPAVEPAS